MVNEMETINPLGTKSMATECVQPDGDEKDRKDAWAKSVTFI